MRETARIQPASRGMKFLYCDKLGNLFLRLVCARWVSRVAGFFLDRRISKPHIKRFVKRHGIELGDYLPEAYPSFNAFFTRRIRPELRPFEKNADALCSPCDGLATAFPITKDGIFTVKGCDYTVAKLLGDEALAAKFEGGTCLIVRLTVKDYHRYHFFDGGTAGESRFLKGKLYTVQPVALERRRVFTENCREVTLLHTDRFGDAVQVEVGATFVGRIVNEKKEKFSRGEEKGRFEFGGSTVIVLFEEGKVLLGGEFFENTAAGLETKGKCGERIGWGA